jgi:hypothetical protein
VADTQIVTPHGAEAASEVRARALANLRLSRWRQALDDFELYVRALAPDDVPSDVHCAMAHAYEALGDGAHAFSAYGKCGDRVALVRRAVLAVRVEAWDELAAAGEALLAHRDADAADRALALGARGLGRIESAVAGGSGTGSPESSGRRGADAAVDDRAVLDRAVLDRAARDVQAGLDVAEELRMGDGGRLPHAMAQLKFALGEVRRLRSEAVALGGDLAGFGARLEQRCAGLLSAQSVYAAAMHADDPRWATLSGLRVGEMYRRLHRDVMAVPRPPQVATAENAQVFYAAMHLRYRILLDKALKMVRGTLELAERTGDTSPWLDRARVVAEDIERAIQYENLTMASFPFTEAEMRAALVRLVGPIRD